MLPVNVASLVSVTVMVWRPLVANVTLNLPTPPESVLLGGKVAAESELEN